MYQVSGDLPNNLSLRKLRNDENELNSCHATGCDNYTSFIRTKRPSGRNALQTINKEINSSI